MNTCGWIDGVGYDLLRHAIDASRTNIVLVLDNERLYSDLQQDLSRVQDRRTRTFFPPYRALPSVLGTQQSASQR